MNTWLVLDTKYLCYRALNTTGGLSHGDIPTGVVYGFLRDVVGFQELFCTTRVVFCFDSAHSHRAALLPTYKRGRREAEARLSPAEAAQKQQMREQIYRLQRRYLPNMGFNNVFQCEGYEADDIIASVCRHGIPAGDAAVIVGSDMDLWQLLETDRVVCYNPHHKTILDAKKFRETWGLDPDQWPDVKALAGCATDDVPGIRGVGELTAAKYLRGELKPGSATLRKIDCPAGHRTWRQNLRLVRLPFNDTPRFELSEDNVTEEGWHNVCDALGLRSLRDMAPIPNRMQRKGFHERRSHCGA
jgi:5'-3' exonuclease